MVTTRRKAATPAQQLPQDSDVSEQGNDVAPTPSASRRHAVQTVTRATTTTRTTTSTATASTAATSRRTRSKATDSPLYSLEREEAKRTTKTAAPKTSAPESSTAQEPSQPAKSIDNKRKRDVSRKTTTSSSPAPAPAPKTAEPQAAQSEDSDEDDQGLFFNKRYNCDTVSGAESFQLGESYEDYLTLSPSPRPRRPSPVPPTPPHVHRQEISQLKARVVQVEYSLAQATRDKTHYQGVIAKLQGDLVLTVDTNKAHLLEIDTLRRHLGLALLKRVKANDICFTQTDYENLGLAVPEDIPYQPEKGLIGNDSALALLRRIENHGNRNRAPTGSDSESEDGTATSPQQPAHPTAAPRSPPRNAASETPARAFSTPSGFFSRSFSAIKSRLGFATPSSVPSAAPAPSSVPSRAPPPDTFTETLSAPPTPIGERRVKRRGRKRRVNPSPMFRLLTKDVPVEEMRAANEWAKQVIPTLKNDVAYKAKLKRLETPVMLKDLINFPSCEPWKSGYGDPLGHLDDDDIVPVWAVYLDMLAEAEEPQKKKSKTDHEDSMDVEDTPSLNDKFGPKEPTKPFNSHGTSASYMAINPRPSREPSPMFASTASPHQGSNIFRKSHDSEVDASEAAVKATPHHDPAQGSYGLDSDSDDDKSPTGSEIAEVESDAAPVWTQSPPPAPTPAHAPLPGGVPEEPTSSAQQALDEVERQRQKIMQHTPAAPTNLRQSFVPSSSPVSDPGNDSIFLGNDSVVLGTPIVAGDMFDDMPDAEDLELDDEILAEVAALAETDEWKARAAEEWADPILTYDSEEETPSPVDA